MNAVNPVPTAASAEPSMEEILASIRRIIADDQSLPGHGGSPILPPDEGLPVAGGSAKVERAAPHSEPIADPPVDLPPEHGVVATPQFVSPEGPSGVTDTRHPLDPRPVPAGPDTGSVDADVPLPQAAAHEPVMDDPILRRLDTDVPDPHEAGLAAMHDEPGVNLHDFVPREPPMSAIQDMSAHDMSAHDVAAHEVSGGAPGGLFSAATSQSLAAAFNTLAVSRLAADSQELRGLAQEMLRPMLKDWLDENLPSMVEGIIRDEIDRMSRGGR